MLNQLPSMKLFVVFLLPGITFATTNIVNTLSGRVEGSTVYYKETLVNRYLGIPYAEPPVGNLRFQKTVPIQPWSGILEAYNWTPKCVQYLTVVYPSDDHLPSQSEDCLHLNIWVPVTDGEEQCKAVMFWIYGGSFSSGTSRQPIYDGHVLAAEGDVIVVTMNYRLSVLGFLSSETDDAPGNMGLFDMAEALKWVNNNIDAFGGDTKRITVFGQSAGSVATGLFAVSPVTKGLFQRIIMESGASSDIFGDVVQRNLELGQQVAVATGCASESVTLKSDPQTVVDCLRGIDAETLVKTVTVINPRSNIAFLPIYGDEFLPIDPSEALKKGYFQDVPVLAGNVKDEGSLTFISSYPELTGIYGEKDPKINKTLGKELILATLNVFNYSSDVAKYYLSGLHEHDYDAVRSQVYHELGDILFFCPELYFVERFSEKGNDVYYYYFYHQISSSVFAKWTGVLHMSDVYFIFGRPLDNPSSYTRKEAQLSEKLIHMWTNFAKCGVPSSTWKKFTKSDPYIQRIYIHRNRNNYLRQHLRNCKFYNKYFGLS